MLLKGCMVQRSRGKGQLENIGIPKWDGIHKSLLPRLANTLACKYAIMPLMVHWAYAVEKVKVPTKGLPAVYSNSFFLWLHLIIKLNLQGKCLGVNLMPAQLHFKLSAKKMLLLMVVTSQLVTNIVSMEMCF